uniref:7TM_GPCR_Srx domain-containing protein n=1 Tax=Angiostrongylus cantonensis TaxID=6313 RepID=A0A0K0D7W8_ANGCA
LHFFSRPLTYSIVDTSTFRTRIFCFQNGVEVAISLYYRCVQFLHVIFSVSAIVLIVWTVMKYREVLIFHNNVKLVLLSFQTSLVRICRPRRDGRLGRPCAPFTCASQW